MLAATELSTEDLEALKEKMLAFKRDEILALENCITIVDKRKQAHVIKLYESQRLSIRHTGRINYEVKVRQEGRTTLHMARAQLRARFQDHFEALILAHEEPAAPVLFEKLKGMDAGLPPILQGKKKTDQAKALRYADSNSLIRIETAGASEAVSSKKARSGTPDWVHVTEAAYIPYLDTLLQGIIGSLPPQGVLILESTSNGPRGAFYAGCVNIKTRGQEVVHGQVWKLGDQVLKFTGLIHHEEYRLSADGYEGPIDEEEERLISLGALPETLMWRRRKLEEFINDPKRSKALSPAKQFKREYPATFEEAFEESGSNFFNPAIMRLEAEAAKLHNERNPSVTLGLMRQNGQRPSEVRATEENRLVVHELPREGYKGRYIVFGDVGAGNSESDPDSLYVLDRLPSPYRSGPGLVAEAHGLLGAIRHSALMLAVAEWYFGAYIGWDATGIGAELRPLILQSGYPLEQIFHRRRAYLDPDKRDDKSWMLDLDGFGLLWGLNRNIGLSLLRHGLESRSLTVYDEDFFDEAQQFGYNEDGKAEAVVGYHDDRIMAAAGAVFLHPILPPPVKEIPLKEFEPAHKLRDRMRQSLMAKVRKQGVMYEGMEA